MNQKYIIALSILAVILVSGCTGTQKPATETPLTARPFVGGTQGVVASFFPGAPADEVVQTKDKQNEVVFTVKLENKGETKVDGTKANIRLTGINTASTAWNIDLKNGKRTSSSEVLDPVQKVSNTLVPGGQLTVDFKSPRGYQGTLEGQFQFKATADVCYAYKSQGVSSACITENLVQQATGANACKTAGARSVYNKGAPVQVTAIEQIPFSKDTIGFQIKVKNVGGGRVFASNTQNCAEKDSTTTVLDKVFIDSVWLGGEKITDNCSPLGTVGSSKVMTLVNGEGSMICKSKLLAGRSGIVEDLLTVNVGYDYNAQASKTFTVRITD
jgi:hypothetical protein